MSETAGPEHRLERLIAFSDAVFAVAITLLIINVQVPHLAPDATNADWTAALVALLPSFAAFALSFVVIGAMWVKHHTIFSMLARYDRSMMWPNLALLASICFLPFSTALLQTARPAVAPYVFYAGSLLVAATLKAVVAAIVLRPRLAAAGVTDEALKVERRRAIAMPIAALFALGLAFVAPGLNNIVMLLIPLMLRLPYFKPAAEPAHAVIADGPDLSALAP